MTHKRIALSIWAKDHTGIRFDMLVAIAPVGKSKNRANLWLCKCDCGKEAIIASNSLTTGNSGSCGCRVRGCTSHGMAHLPEYKPWTAMKYRCDNTNNASYHKYGGRGISVCDRWYDFALFMEDMGAKPSTKHSIERIDNDGDYCPENCRWATPKEQARNTRQNHWLTYKGETMCLRDWSIRIGMNEKTLGHRVRKMSVETAIETPVRYRRKP